MCDLSWLEGILFSPQSTQMLIGAQQWPLTDFLEARWHFPSFFVTWINSLLQPAFKSVKEEKRKEQNSCWTPAVHLSHLHPTAVSARASPKPMRCSCIYAQYIYQKQRNKNPGRNCTNSSNTEAPTPAQPSAVLSPSLCSLGLHQADTSRAGSAFPAGHSSSQSLTEQHTPAHPVSVLGTQNCSQSLSRSFSDQNITKGMIHHPWHSLRELHEVTHTRGAVMANPHFKGTSLEIKPAKALKTQQRPLPCQVLWDCLPQSGHAAAL